MQPFLHRRHRHRHHHSSSGLSHESTSTFERVASRDSIPFPPVLEHDSKPADVLTNGSRFSPPGARRKSAEAQQPPTSQRQQQSPAQRSLVSIISSNLILGVLILLSLVIYSLQGPVFSANNSNELKLLRDMLALISVVSIAQVLTFRSAQLRLFVQSYRPVGISIILKKLWGHINL